MIVSIMQPAYLPWLGYFDRIARSDLYIVLDSVEIERNTKTAFTNRNRIRTASGHIWLTVPVRRGATADEAIIRNVAIDGPHWQRKHWQSLSQSYGRAPHFSEVCTFLEPIYREPWRGLNDLLNASTGALFDAMGMRVNLVSSTSLNVTSKKAALILDLCSAVGATTYLSGSFGRDYLDLREFDRAGIDVDFHDYAHPTYHQLHGDFEPYMSIVDLLFNCGPASLSILRNSSTSVQ